IWSKIDRLSEGGKYGASLEEKKQELIRFLARAYRNFIDKGLHIELNGRVVTLHDPTFRLLNPRALDYFPDDPRAKVIEEVTFDIDDHEVHAVVTLYPEEVRHTSGQGGLQYKDLYIADNERKGSILRN